MPWRDAEPPNAERDPERLKGSIDRLARRLGAPTAGALAGLFHRWEEIVGSSIAVHAKPVGLRRGRLTVEADSNIWAAQLRYMTADLTTRCCEVLGPGAVEQIDVRVKRS